MEKALVIFSGGMDSTTCLYWAINKYDEVEAITFDYGQKHIVELEQAKKICRITNTAQTIINLDFLKAITESPLIDGGSTTGKNKKGFAAAHVPNRNQLFITLAHALAQKIGANTIVLGVCQTDEQGFPDCRLRFITLIQQATNKGAGLTADDSIQLATPLMHLTKSETFALAQKENALEHVIVHSHTCYTNRRDRFHSWGYGCGTCPACKERKAGYLEFINQ